MRIVVEYFENQLLTGIRMILCIVPDMYQRTTISLIRHEPTVTIIMNCIQQVIS